MKKKQVLATLCAGMMVASVATGCGSAAEFRRGFHRSFH